jgi:hypothetical protein
MHRRRRGLKSKFCRAQDDRPLSQPGPSEQASVAGSPDSPRASMRSISGGRDWYDFPLHIGVPANANLTGHVGLPRAPQGDHLLLRPSLADRTSSRNKKCSMKHLQCGRWTMLTCTIPLRPPPRFFSFLSIKESFMVKYVPANEIHCRNLRSALKASGESGNLCFC